MHHDGRWDDADADEEVRHGQGQDKVVGDGAQLGRGDHGGDDQEVARLRVVGKKRELTT